MEVCDLPEDVAGEDVVGQHRRGASRRRSCSIGRSPGGCGTTRDRRAPRRPIRRFVGAAGARSRPPPGGQRGRFETSLRRAMRRIRDGVSGTTASSAGLPDAQACARVSGGGPITRLSRRWSPDRFRLSADRIDNPPPESGQSGATVSTQDVYSSHGDVIADAPLADPALFDPVDPGVRRGQRQRLTANGQETDTDDSQDGEPASPRRTAKAATTGRSPTRSRRPR